MSLPPGRTLLDLTASEAAAAVAAHTITSEDLTRACLDASARLDGEIGAWAALDAEHAVAQARAADERLRSGLGVGPLHGVPIAIKDVIDTADLPTEHGSPIFRGHRPERDAVCVANLRAAGAVILGKTVTTELASLTPAPTRNSCGRLRTACGPPSRRVGRSYLDLGSAPQLFVKAACRPSRARARIRATARLLNCIVFIVN